MKLSCVCVCVSERPQTGEARQAGEQGGSVYLEAADHVHSGCSLAEDATHVPKTTSRSDFPWHLVDATAAGESYALPLPRPREWLQGTHTEGHRGGGSR